MKTATTPTEFLREACRLDGRNINRLARDAGVPVPVLWRFVRGERPTLNTATLDRLADALDLELVPRRVAA